MDNGTEFHNYRQIEDHTDVVCYFATPYHSWERGTNENFTGLDRQSNEPPSAQATREQVS